MRREDRRRERCEIVGMDRRNLHRYYRLAVGMRVVRFSDAPSRAQPYRAQQGHQGTAAPKPRVQPLLPVLSGNDAGIEVVVEKDLVAEPDESVTQLIACGILTRAVANEDRGRGIDRWRTEGVPRVNRLRRERTAARQGR